MLSGRFLCLLGLPGLAGCVKLVVGSQLAGAA